MNKVMFVTVCMFVIDFNMSKYNPVITKFIDVIRYDCGKYSVHNEVCIF